MRVGIVLFCLVLIEVTELEAAGIRGKVDLPEPAVQRRSSERYTASPDARPGPPAPRLGVVYLEGEFPEKSGSSGPDRMVAVYQRGLQFYPSLLAIEKGTKVSFPNEDNVYHNVFSYTPGNRFDLGRYRKGEEPPSVLFEEPGVVRLFCEIHGHMRGTILILESPFFTLTSPEGHFEMKGLPEGSYELVAWLEEDRIYRKKIELKEGLEEEVHFEASRP